MLVVFVGLLMYVCMYVCMYKRYERVHMEFCPALPYFSFPFLSFSIFPVSLFSLFFPFLFFLFFFFVSFPSLSFPFVPSPSLPFPSLSRLTHLLKSKSQPGITAFKLLPAPTSTEFGTVEHHKRGREVFVIYPFKSKRRQDILENASVRVCVRVAVLENRL